MMQDLVVLCAAYLIGSIPTGFLVARLQGIADIRKYGSGNIGATNVSRVLGGKYFILVLILDAVKAYGTIKILHYFGFSYAIQLIAAALVLIGNAASVFLNFRGGKGVATTVGILAALLPQLLPVAALFFLISLMITRTVGISSVFTFLFLICWAILIYEGLFNTLEINTQQLLLILFISCFGIFLHRENIKKYIAQ